jgi:hypothetical protein
VATSKSRAALFLMENEALALELQSVLKSGGADWTVMLTRVANAARSALLGGTVDLAVIVPGATEVLDELLSGLINTGTPTILVSGQGGQGMSLGQSDLITLVSRPLDVDVLKHALQRFALTDVPSAAPRVLTA